MTLATENAMTVVVPNASGILSDTRNLLTEAQSIEVVDIPTHERASKALIGIKRVIRTLHEGDIDAGGKFPGLDAACDQAFKLHKTTTQIRSAAIDPYEAARKVIERKIVTYEGEAQRKAEEEARRQQEAARKAEEERQLADAQAAHDAGDEAQAESILNEPVNVPVIAPAPAVAKVAGVASVTRYGAEVTDLSALIKYVASRPEFTNLLMPNGPALNALARAQRENLRIPGVRLTKDVSKSIRS